MLCTCCELPAVRFKYPRSIRAATAATDLLPRFLLTRLSPAFPGALTAPQDSRETTTFTAPVVREETITAPLPCCECMQTDAPYTHLFCARRGAARSYDTKQTPCWQQRDSRHESSNTTSAGSPRYQPHRRGIGSKEDQPRELKSASTHTYNKPESSENDAAWLTTAQDGSKWDFVERDVVRAADSPTTLVATTTVSWVGFAIQ